MQHNDVINICKIRPGFKIEFLKICVKLGYFCPNTCPCFRTVARVRDKIVFALHCIAGGRCRVSHCANIRVHKNLCGLDNAK
jgi:hypothetical protein